MEFKEAPWPVYSVTGFRINRIRLEFKVRQCISLLIPSRVLIESDWNLKDERIWVQGEGAAVLIESDWNLKKNLFCILKIVVPCINRIRLEFKVIDIDIAATIIATVLIESDWNLKHYETQCLHYMAVVLIESDWNLKLPP